MIGRRRNKQYRPLEDAIGYRFRHDDLLVTALTHRSYRFEHKDAEMDNQRLEFLGDAVLGLATASSLYEEFPHLDEGIMTALRSRMTNGDTLAEVGRTLKLGDFVRLGRGEEASGGRDRASTLADGVEALIGAVYLDGGWKGAQKVVARLLGPYQATLSQDIWSGNPKGQLQEYCQRVWKTSPCYRVVSRRGTPHEAVFAVDVEINGRVHAHGVGRSKQQAESDAAAKALEGLELEPGMPDMPHPS